MRCATYIIYQFDVVKSAAQENLKKKKKKQKQNRNQQRTNSITNIMNYKHPLRTFCRQNRRFWGFCVWF